MAVFGTFSGATVICIDQVQFGEYGSSIKDDREILDVRYRVSVQDSNVIQGPIVPTGMPIS